MQVFNFSLKVDFSPLSFSYFTQRFIPQSKPQAINHQSKKCKHFFAPPPFFPSSPKFLLLQVLAKGKNNNALSNSLSVKKPWNLLQYLLR